MANEIQPTHSGDLLADSPELTLDDLCDACNLSRTQIEAYVSEGIIVPYGTGQTHWRFSHLNLIVVRRAKRLESDLGLNAAGVALALDLMSQIETLKSRLTRYEQSPTKSE